MAVRFLQQQLIVQFSCLPFSQFLIRTRARARTNTHTHTHTHTHTPTHTHTHTLKCVRGNPQVLAQTDSK